MPITEMRFNDGILFVREIGRIEKEDAKHFAEMVAHYAANHPTPIGTVIDATQVKFITTDARKVFVRTSLLPKFAFSAIAAEDLVTVQTARIIGNMAEDGHSYIFPSLEEAWDFALSRIKSAGVG